MNTWLLTCSEKELFVYIENLTTALIEEENLDHTSREWILQTESDIMNAQAQTARFGIGRGWDNFREWYKLHKLWYMNLKPEDVKLWLKQMPWNHSIQ
jgi:hypothetical protein